LCRERENQYTVILYLILLNFSYIFLKETFSFSFLLFFFCRFTFQLRCSYECFSSFILFFSLGYNIQHSSSSISHHKRREGDRRITKEEENLWIFRSKSKNKRKKSSFFRCHNKNFRFPPMLFILHNHNRRYKNEKSLWRGNQQFFVFFPLQQKFTIVLFYFLCIKVVSSCVYFVLF
jgi:hypothetical protein